MRNPSIILCAAGALAVGWGVVTPAPAQEPQLLTLASNDKLCLSIPSADPADGTTLQVAACTGAAPQQFVLTREGALKALAGSGRTRDGREMCVDHWPDYNAGGAVKVWPCRGSMQNDPQRWRLTTEKQYVSDARLCMEVRGSQLAVSSCSVSAGQTFQPRTVGKPVITRVDPGPWPVNGTLLVQGENLAAGTLGVSLTPRDYNRNGTSYSGDRRITARTAQEVRMDLAGVPSGSYTLAVEIFDAGGREVLLHRADVVIGAPSAMGPPVVRQVGPKPANMGREIYLEGESFADDVEVHLVAESGARHTLPRGSGGPSFNRIQVTVPSGLQPGTYGVLAMNPSQQTSSGTHEILVLRAGQSLEEWEGEKRAAAEAEAIRKAMETEQARTAEEEARRRQAEEAARAEEAPRTAPDASPVAFNVAITTASGMCLTPDADRAGARVTVRLCSDGGAMYRIENGYAVTANGNCLTPVARMQNAIVLQRCMDGRRDGTMQQWYFHGNKLAQNAARANLCMDIQGASKQAGARVIGFECKNYENPAENQRFSIGGSFPLGPWALAQMPAAAQQALQSQGGAALFSNGTWVIAAGGGNVIAAGGGNVIAAGGGNVIAAGGGNVIASGGGNVIASGGGNVISLGGNNLRIVQDPTLLIQGASVIAAGGGNVIAAGALN
ncbi:hypothetical protein BH23GEM3_BH23GEM3_08740 [soil metagenome]